MMPFSLLTHDTQHVQMPGTAILRAQWNNECLNLQLRVYTNLDVMASSAAHKNVTNIQFAITYLRVAIMTRVGAAGSPTRTHVESSE